MSRKSVAAAVPQTTPEDWPLAKLRHFEPNPRRIETDDFVVLCRSIARFGLVDTLVCAEDGRVLGGNQRLDAVLALGKGFEAPRLDDPEKRELLRWEPAGGLVHVMVVRGAPETQLKALNIALNKHAGKFIEDQVTVILREVRDYDASLLGAIDTGDEIDRLLADPEEAGGEPPQARGVPSINLQFASAGAHTRVKKRLAEGAAKLGGEKKVASGDVLDKLLASAPKVSAPAKKAGSKRSATARA